MANNNEELVLLKKIAEGTSSVVGKDFLKELVKCLADTIGVYGVWITELLEKEQRLNALAFWLNGHFVDHYEYAIAGTPCQPVIGCPADIFHVPERVIQLFPGDPDLPRLHAVSYMGVALTDQSGKVLGHLAVLDNKPMPRRPRIMTIFRIFAARAAAELQSIEAEKLVRESEQRLSRLINGTNDAILEVDEHLQVTQANYSAKSMFTLPENLSGFSLKHVLTAEGLQKIIQALLLVKEKSTEKAYHWIQGYVPCLTAGGESFPAEATITESIVAGKSYYILILRNAHYKLEAEETIRTLRRETSLLREEIKKIYSLDEITGESPVMLQAMNAVRLVAAASTTVLLTGETGTGKELFARAIHNMSTRKDKPMVKLNCAALPAMLIESELFGHEKGAFTGASGRREGRFVMAHNSSIFLDEIGELPLELQAKLLRVLQEGEFEPVGSNTTIKVNARVIAATNRDLFAEVKKGRFREDLYYRLNVYPVHVPPLRERGEDVLLLANRFLHSFAQQMHKNLPPLTANQKQSLLAYHWPGNVRELQNVMERAVITLEGDNLDFTIYPHSFKPVATEPSRLQKVLTATEWKALEKENILLALHAACGKISGPQGAAALLGMPATTLSSRIKALGLHKVSFSLQNAG